MSLEFERQVAEALHLPCDELLRPVLRAAEGFGAARDEDQRVFHRKEIMRLRGGLPSGLARGVAAAIDEAIRQFVQLGFGSDDQLASDANIRGAFATAARENALAALRRGLEG